MKKSILAGAVAACSLSVNALAANDLQSFFDESTIDVNVRSAYIKLNPNDVVFDTQYDIATASGLLVQLDPTQAATVIAGAQFYGYAGSADASNPADVAAAISYLDTNVTTDGSTLTGVIDGINSGLKDGVEKEGALDQSGSAVWVQMESAYLFDIIGFDLGFQGALKHTKEDESSMLIIASQDDETYSRISTARLKLRYGSEDVYAKAHYGRYSAADETDYLMDSTDMKYGASAHYHDLSLSYSATTASAGNTESELVEKDQASESIKLSYESDFGNASYERSYTQDVSAKNTFSAASGVPFSMMGLPVPQDKAMDYLLLAQVDYANETLEADSDYAASQYEITLAAKLDGIVLAASYNQASDDGGAGVANLVDNALINDYDMPGQTTLTYVAQIDSAMFGLPGLTVSAVHLSSSNIDMASTDMAYQLTGDDAFTETLIDAKYSFGGILEGLSVRGIFGNETNQANVSGFGAYVDYHLTF